MLRSAMSFTLSYFLGRQQHILEPLFNEFYRLCMARQLNNNACTTLLHYTYKSMLIACDKLVGILRPGEAQGYALQQQQHQQQQAQQQQLQQQAANNMQHMQGSIPMPPMPPYQPDMGAGAAGPADEDGDDAGGKGKGRGQRNQRGRAAPQQQSQQPYAPLPPLNNGPPGMPAPLLIPPPPPNPSAPSSAGRNSPSTSAASKKQAAGAKRGAPTPAPANYGMQGPEYNGGPLDEPSLKRQQMTPFGADPMAGYGGMGQGPQGGMGRGGPGDFSQAANRMHLAPPPPPMHMPGGLGSGGMVPMGGFPGGPPNPMHMPQSHGMPPLGMGPMGGNPMAPNGFMPVGGMNDPTGAMRAGPGGPSHLPSLNGGMPSSTPWNMGGLDSLMPNPGAPSMGMGGQGADAMPQSNGTPWGLSLTGNSGLGREPSAQLLMPPGNAGGMSSMGSDAGLLANNTWPGGEGLGGAMLLPQAPAAGGAGASAAAAPGSPAQDPCDDFLIGEPDAPPAPQQPVVKQEQSQGTE